MYIWCTYTHNAVYIGVNMVMKVYKGCNMMVLVPFNKGREGALPPYIPHGLFTE